MRRFQKIFLLFLFTAMLLSGSGQKKAFVYPPPTLRMVTEMEITCQTGQDTITRHYTHPEKIKPFLTYFRLLDYRGHADTDPERLSGTSFEIVLHYSDGQRRVYRQRADQYLSKDSHPWEKIDPDQAKFLYPLLQAVPGDP